MLDDIERDIIKPLGRKKDVLVLMALAHNLGRAIDLVANKDEREKKRKKGKKFNTRMRIATLRRKLFALPAFIKVHARKSTVHIIGGGEQNLLMFQKYWDAIQLC